MKFEDIKNYSYKPLPDYLEIKNSQIHGLGLFATKNIKGIIDLGISHIKLPNYFFRTPIGGFINGTDIPNVVMVRHIYDTFKYNFITLSSIEKGEELLIDYSTCIPGQSYCEKIESTYNKDNLIKLKSYCGGSGIYCIKNTINNKVYIGSTNCFKERKYRHFLKLRTNKHRNQHLQNSYNKYGKEVFVFEILSYVPVDYLLQVEQWFLDKFAQDNWSNNYNILKNAKGGFPEELLRSINQYNLQGDLITKHSHIKQAAIVTNIKYNAIRSNCRGDSISTHNYIFSFSDDINRNNEIENNINQYLMGNRPGKHYNKIYLGSPSKGKKWSKKAKMNANRTPVIVKILDLDGNAIGLYTSIRKCSKHEDVSIYMLRKYINKKLYLNNKIYLPIRENITVDYTKHKFCHDKK